MKLIRRSAYYGVGILILSYLVGCKKKDEGADNESDSSQQQTVRADQPAGKNRQIYTNFCSFCHGVDREGSEGLRLTDLEISSDGIRTILTEGRAGMPPFPHLSPEQLDDIIEYVKSDVN